MPLIPDMDKKMQDRIAERRFALKKQISRLEARDDAGEDREKAEQELAEIDRLVTLAIEQQSESATRKLDEMLH